MRARSSTGWTSGAATYDSGFETHKHNRPAPRCSAPLSGLVLDSHLAPSPVASTKSQNARQRRAWPSAASPNSRNLQHNHARYDRFSLEPVKQLTYTGEGWGMTRTNKEIITSDGSPILRFRDPQTFAETRHIEVTDNGQAVEELNELEYIKGQIYANVWHSDRIARISPRDGHVIGWIDLTGILPASQKINDESVPNGIAYDSQHDRLFVT